MDTHGHDFYFNRCSFTSGDEMYEWAVWPNARNMNFTCCSFYGPSGHPYDASPSGNRSLGTKFIGCDFNEKYNDGVNEWNFNWDADINYCSHSALHSESHEYLLSFENDGIFSATCGGLLFEECTFTVNYGLKFCSIFGTPGLETIMRNCNFYNYGRGYTSADYFLGQLYHAKLYNTVMHTVQAVPLTGSCYNFYMDPISVIAPNKIGVNTGNHAWENWNTNWCDWPNLLSVFANPVLQCAADGRYHKPTPGFRWVLGAPIACTGIPQWCPTEISCLDIPIPCQSIESLNQAAERRTNENSSNLNIISSPVPATDYVMIENLEKGQVIVLRDIAGKELFRSILTDTKVIINLQDLNPGIYMVEYAGKQFNKLIKL